MAQQAAMAIDTVLTEHADLERQLSDPALHGDAANARRVGRRFAQLAPIVATYRRLETARGDLEAARELAAEDASFAAEVPELETRVAELDAHLTDLLAPRDPHDADDIVLEVKSGEGGEESALFAADLARMYIRYAERHGWTVTLLDETTSDLGGYKDVQVAIKTVQELLGQKPIFGICMGHQILGLALGGKTYKLKFGHRGANHPVLNRVTGKVEITSHNHGFAVDPDSLNANEIELTHVNLNDQTLEGFRHRKEPVFCVQYHPEAAPGPHDSHYLFDDFIRLMRECKGGK